MKQGEPGHEMYVVARGEVEVMDGDARLATLGEGNFFGEQSLLLAAPRSASVRALTACDLFVLDKTDFQKVLWEHPRLARSILEVSRKRYNLAIAAADAFDTLLERLVDDR